MIVSVIGCGPSALRCGAERSPGIRVGVNDAYRHVYCNHVVSMDGRWFDNRWEDFCDAMSPMLHTRIGTKGAENLPKVCRTQPFKCDRKTTKFGDSISQLNGENSGYCALNLAYLLKPTTIYLYGFDMTFEKGSDHFFGDYEWKGQGCSNSAGKFAKWAKEMDDAARQFEEAGIEVFNTNKQSAIKAFKYGVPK